MSRSKRLPVPDEQRTKIEVRHAAELAALAEHAAAADRLALLETKRLQVLADQDQRVAEAREDRVAAAAALARLIGVARASDLTGVKVPELRRSTRDAEGSAQ